MKKLFSIVAAALMSVAMYAGDNDRVWDYSAGAPSSKPDNGLYYDSKVTDGPGVKNGLYGIKMNGSGYAYFTKPAVAGTLKLGFGPRSGSNAEKMAILTWEGDAASATVPTGLKGIDTTGAQTEYGFQTIELTAEQNNIYIKRAGSVESVLQYLQFKEKVTRTFTDFEMIMCNMAEEYDFTTLPEGVTASGAFNTDQHGYRNFMIVVPVDGTVRFTIGDCKYGNQAIPVKNKKGETIASLNYPQAGCYKNDDQNKGNIFSYNYIGEADTLTFGPIQYCNYFKAEAAEITPCEIIFKDQNGTELGRVETYEGAKFDGIPAAIVAKLPAVAEGNAFRGWYYTNGKRAIEGDPINGNTTIQAKETPIETVTVGSVQTYDFANQIFYPEDHETVETNKGEYYNNHGWYFAADGSIRVQVAGNAVVIVTLCQYSESGDVVVKADETELSKFSVVKNSTADGTELTAQYKGDAGWLTISWTAKQYIHKVVVYNVLDFLEKDEATGYFIVPSGDAAAFILALTQAQSDDKIFLPNGLYDLGESTLTTIGKNNIAIIGQSMEGVIIKNAPQKPGIGATATLKINKNVENTYLQDLTLFDNYDYYKNNDGVGVALQDQGTKTICKNVRLLGFQDTYYSNLQGAVKYFEDCEIHGTVDFICGDGSVYFKNNLLVGEQRNASGGGANAITASNADASDKGYVFESCRVKYAEDIQGTLPVMSLGRSWNNAPKCIFLNTVLDDSNGELIMTKSASAQKDKIERWTLGAMNILPEKFGEFNSVNEAGQVVSPASNNVTFVLGSNEKQMETILTADEAATYTIDYTLGDWAPTAQSDAQQAICEKTADELEPNAIYMAEAEGELPILFKGSEFYDKVALYNGIDYKLRKANGRGGFGEVAEEGGTEAIDNTGVNAKAVKIIRDGQVIIVREKREYTILGTQL